MAQNAGDRDAVRADDGVDAEPRENAFVNALVDQGDRARTALALGQDRGEDVGFVVVGHRHDGLAGAEIGLGEDLPVERVAMQDHGVVAEFARDVLGAHLRILDDLQRQRRRALGELLCQVQPDIAAADDHHAVGDLLLVTEIAHHAGGLARAGDDIDRIPELHAIGRRRHESLTAAHQRDDDHGGQGRGQIVEPAAEHGAAARCATDAEQLNAAVGERDRVECAGRLQTPHDAVGDLQLRRDDHVDRELVAGIEAAPDRGEIALVAQAGDAARYLEQRIGDLAGHHVDLVRSGDRDQHVRFPRAGLLQHFRIGGVADHAAHVEGFVDAPRLGRRYIDDRDVDALHGEMACNG